MYSTNLCVNVWFFFFQIVQRGLMTQAEYDEASSKALSLFEYGQVMNIVSWQPLKEK